MKSIVSIILFIIVIQSSLNAEEFKPVKSITIGIPDHGYPPYIIIKNNIPEGIVIDPVFQIAKKLNVSITIKKLPEKRSQVFLDRGLIDARHESRDWVSNPENYLWSIPFCDVSDVLVFLKSRPVRFHTLNDLKGIVVHTHIGYGYPTLEPYFKSGTITRLDYRSESLMLKTLLHPTALDHGRAAVMNRFVALWVLKDIPELHGQVEFSKTIISSSPFQLQVRNSPAMKPFVDGFNIELKKLKERGEIQQNIIRLTQY